MKVFNDHESEVRSYCRSFPTVFDRAVGSRLHDEEGREYIDFFAGAGALNYGHNNRYLKARLLEYLERDGITHSLDMATAAKRSFIEAFQDIVLRPRELEYKMMFPGPTGTNAVESALKLARKVTGRSNIVAFTNAFHGMTLGSLAITGNESKRSGAGVPLHNTSRIPFDGYLGPDVDTLDMLEQLLEDTSSGVEPPAAVVVETIQAEGGVNACSDAWLRRLAELARAHEALLVVDDIQVGCGRTGPFFSFEAAGVTPDIVCLSKSLSGFGLPLAVTLLSPEFDAWDPGEHNGTFRGHNPAFVTATAALERYWRGSELSREVARKAEEIRERLDAIASRHDAEARGRGMIQGIAFGDETLASRISRRAFENGLLIETSGASDEVIKVLPPLTIDDRSLKKGLGILERSIESVVGHAVGGSPLARVPDAISDLDKETMEVSG